MAANDRSLALELSVVGDELTSGLAKAAGQIRGFATEAVATLNGAGRGGAGAFNPIGEAANGAGRAVSAFASSAKAEMEKVADAGRNVGLVYQRIFEAFIGAEVVKQLFGMAVAADDLKLHFAQAAAIAGNLGHAFKADDLQAYVEKLAVSAQGGGYAIGQMADAAQRFAGLGAGFQQIQYLLTTTSKLAAGLGIDYDRAAQLLERGAAGMEVSLRRVGISVRDAQGNFKSLDEIVSEINARFQDAAERRAASLAGQLGVVSNAAERLRDEFGAAMLPALTLVLGGVEKLIDAIARLSPQVKTNIAIGVALAAVLTTVGLVAGVLVTAIEALGAALAIVTSPIGLVIAAVVALIAVFVEARSHPAAFHNALLTALNAARDAIDRFVEWVKNRFADLREIFQGIVQLSAGNYTAGATLIGAGIDSTKRSFVDLGHTISTAISGGFSAGVDAAKRAWADLQSFLKPKELGNAGARAVSLAGIGNPPGTKGSGAGGAATNALDNLKSGVESYLAGFAERVDDAKQKVDLAKAALDLFKAGEDTSAGKSYSDALAEQKLISQQIGAQKEQQAAISAQIAAKTAAERAYEQAARSVSPTLKDHDALVRSATAAAREQAKGVADLKVQWAEVGVSIAQGALAIRTAWKDAFAEIARLQKDANQAILDTVDAARAAGDEDLYTRNEGRERQITGLEQQKALGRAGGRSTSLSDAKLDVAIAQLRLAMAQDALATAQHTAAVAHDADAIAQTKASRDAALRADREVATATDAVTKAQGALAVGMETLTKDLSDSHFTFQKLLDGIEAKSGISKLGLNANPAQGSGALSFNPLQLLLNAFEQTRAFADIQKTVNELMKAFAQILDALKPVIDALLHAVIDVANGFIDVWNVIARIVRVLGIQLPLLDQLNADFSGLIPVIQVIHDIPTLNELAAGSTGNLSNKPVDPATLNAPVVTQLQSPSLGGGMLNVLAEIFGVLVAIKLLMGAATATNGLIQGILGAVGLSGAAAGGLGSAGFADAATAFLASSSRRAFGGAASNVANNIGGGGGQAGLAPPGGTQVGTLSLAISTGDIHGYDDVQHLSGDIAEALSRALGLTQFGLDRTPVVS